MVPGNLKNQRLKMPDTEKLPIEIQIAFVDQIESAAQGWKDGVQSYTEFREILDRMSANIYRAGMEDTHGPYAYDLWFLPGV